MDVTQKIQPRINAINRPFWEACNDDRLLIQRCEASACGQWTYFPRVCCPHCGGGLRWTQASGEGTVKSFTVIRRPQHPSFLPDVPYYFIAVELKEGPLIYSRLHHAYCSDLAPLNQPVKVTFVEHGPKQKLPFFVLLGAESAQSA